MSNETFEIKRKQIYRSVPVNPFQHDKRLDLAAKGLLAILLSFPDTWTIYFSDIVARSASGRDATASALNKLIQCGYIYRKQRRDKNGKFQSYSYIVFESPEDKTDKLLPETENPETENPETENPETGKPEPGNPQLNILNNKELNNKDLNLKDFNIYQQLAELLRSAILKRKPDCKVPGNLTNWTSEIRLMVENDCRSIELIRTLIAFSQQNEFWRNVILSASSLRKNFDKLELAAQATKKASDLPRGFASLLNDEEGEIIDI